MSKILLFLLAMASMSFGTVTSHMTEDITTSGLGLFTNFNQLDAFISPSATFSASGLSGFGGSTGASTWTGIFETPGWFEAAGVPIAKLSFNTIFNDPTPNVAITLDLFAFNNVNGVLTMEDSVRLTYINGSFNGPPLPQMLTFNQYQQDVALNTFGVPEPSSFTLILIAGLTYIGLRCKIRQSSSG
jgi:hypothetical protein